MKAIVNYTIKDIELSSLEKLGIKCFPSDRVNSYEAVSSHPDLQFHNLKGKLFCHKDISSSLLKKLMQEKDIDLNITDYKILENYPGNISLNAFSNNNIFLHNTAYTEKSLLEYAKEKSINILNIKQGYTACTTAGNEDIFLSNDLPSAKILANFFKDISKVLYLKNGDIILRTFDYGFIGGSIKFIKIDNKDVLLTFGSLSKYIYGKEVKEFLKKNNSDIIELSDGKLTDYGGMVVF